VLYAIKAINLSSKIIKEARNTLPKFLRNKRKNDLETNKLIIIDLF